MKSKEDRYDKILDDWRHAISYAEDLRRDLRGVERGTSTFNDMAQQIRDLEEEAENLKQQARELETEMHEGFF